MSDNCTNIKVQFPEIPANVKYEFDLRNFNNLLYVLRN